MKLFLLIVLPILFISEHSFAQVKTVTFTQVKTVTKRDCILRPYYTRTPAMLVKKGTTILLIDNYPANEGLFKIKYKNTIYHLRKEYISDSGISAFYKYKKASFSKEQRQKNQKEAVVQKQTGRQNMQAEDDRFREELRAEAKEFSESWNIIIDSLYEKAGYPIAIGTCWPIQNLYSGGSNGETGKRHRPKEIGGERYSSFCFGYQNISKDVIKKIIVTGYPVNAKGEKVYCKLYDISEISVECTGPVEQKEPVLNCFEDQWFNPTIDDFNATSIKIEYMNGKIVSLNEKKIKEMRNNSGYITTAINKLYSFKSWHVL